VWILSARLDGATMRDKAFQMVARCARCGRGKNQHRASTLECPKGKRTPSGYSRFSHERFLEMSRDPQSDVLLGGQDSSSKTD
jgi:hypothetical protein